MTLQHMNTRLLFGNDAGEEEDRDFLKDAYVESASYQRALSDERIICIRSRKGVGKSALLVRAQLEISSKDLPAFRLTPTDLASESEALSFNAQVLAIKKRFARLCCGKLVEEARMTSTGDAAAALKMAEDDGFRSADLLSSFARAFQGVARAQVPEAPSDTAAPRILQRLATGAPLFAFIDDVDRGWRPDSQEQARVSAMITALREVARDVPQIRIRIAIREDVWQFLERKDEQFDKFRQYSELLSWSFPELKRILAQRIRIYLLRTQPRLLSASYDDYACLSALFDMSYPWGDEMKQTPDVMATLARWRPRDLLQLARGAADRGKHLGHVKISASDVESEYRNEYSRVRVLDLAKEFVNECPEVESLINAFAGRRQSWLVDYEETMRIVRSVNGRTGITIFGRAADDIACLAFLFRCGFLSAHKSQADGSYEHLHYETYPQLVEARVGLEHFFWEPHPAFRPFLEVQDASHNRVVNRARKKRRIYR